MTGLTLGTVEQSRKLSLVILEILEKLVGEENDVSEERFHMSIYTSRRDSYVGPSYFNCYSYIVVASQISTTNSRVILQNYC